jgi:hypothetical protein
VSRAFGRAACLAIAVLATLAACAASSAPPEPPDPAPGAGPTRHVGPTDRSCAGIAVAPTDDVQAALDAHPEGSTFCLSAGTYRLAVPLAPKRGDALVGQRGAVLSGAKVVEGWRAAGTAWTAAGFLPPAPLTSDYCLESAPLCTPPEDVFVDGRPLRPVASADAVTAGTFYADYSANTLTIGDDPHAHLVEQAVAPGLVQATVDDVTVANLVLEHAANPAQVGAVENRRDTPSTSGSGWRVVDNEVRFNHGVGVGVADASTVTGNSIHDQGQLGVGAWGTGAVVSDNEIARNGGAGYDPDWETGGAKLWTTTDMTLSHNWVHDNVGPGLWADGGNIDTTYTYNKITGNDNAGIQHEISYDATIMHNEIAGNGKRRKGWAWDAGIQIQSSGGIRLIEVAYNKVTGNANGISLIDSGDRTAEQPAPHGPHVVRNVWVHDNVVGLATGQLTGAVEDNGDAAIFTSNGNRFEANTYHLASLSEEYFAWNGDDVDWDGWRGGAGNDVTGHATGG